jgi:iron(III) transport system permease protein
MARRAFLTFIVILLLTIGMLPVLSMLTKSVSVEGHFSLEAYRGLLTSRHQWALMGHSMYLSVLVTVLTTAVGLPLGILLERTDLHFRRLFLFLFVIPLLIPPYITAVSWFDFLGREGLLAQLIGHSFAKTTARFLFGLPGCVAVLFSTFLPIPMLLTMVFLRTINPGLEEAGRLVSGWRGVMKGITIPLILPGVLLSAMLVFLLSFGEFGVPNFLRYDVFPVESFTQFSAFYNFKAATAAAVPLAAVTLMVLLAEAGFLRERTYQMRPSPEVKHYLRSNLGLTANGCSAS